MKFRRAIILIFFASFAILSAGPKIKIDGGNSYNWGKVKPDNPQLKVKIKIYNVGTDTLHITSVKPGCGCTTAPLDKDKIEAGGFATLDVSLNIGASQGQISKNITIKCNDPENETINFELKAEVSRPLSVFPRFLSFSNMKVGRTDTTKVYIENSTDKDIKVTSVTVEPSKLKINLEQGSVIPAKGKFLLYGAYLPDNHDRFAGKITFKTNNPDAPVIDISAWGNVQSDAAPKSSGTQSQVQTDSIAKAKATGDGGKQPGSPRSNPRGGKPGTDIVNPGNPQVSPVPVQLDNNAIKIDPALNNPANQKVEPLPIPPAPEMVAPQAVQPEPEVVPPVEENKEKPKK